MDSKPSILMLPWLAHGHVSPFFELARRLTFYNFHIYFCSTPLILESIKAKLDGNDLSSSIQLIEIHLPPFPELPPHYHATKNLPPHLMHTLKTAFDASKPAFSDILRALKPNLLVHDFLQQWAPEAALEQNIQSILFLTFNAACSSFLLHQCKCNGTKYPFAALDFPEPECHEFTEFMRDVANGMTTYARMLSCIATSSGVLVKTWKEIEAKYVDYLAELAGKDIISVGPLVQDPAKTEDEETIMEWLSRKDPSSTVFVSFGTEYFLSREEFQEIAHGLELSRFNFIWVVRFHGGQETDINSVLPEDFMKKARDRGLIVQGWAPQSRILQHPSIGGFVSHCGWSSTLEGIMLGVPIVVMPMQLDQPFNARVVVEVGVGMEVERENGRYQREEVARVIQEVVVGEEGREVRRKAKEMSRKIKEMGDEELDVAVKKLMALVSYSGKKA